MTKENRENLYKHLRDLEKNYEAREGLNSGPTATSKVRARAKESADAILAKHPELDVKEEKKVDEDASMEETDKGEKEKSKSKGNK